MSTVVIDPHGNLHIVVLVQERLQSKNGTVLGLKDRATFQVSSKALIQTCEAFKAAFHPERPSGTYWGHITFVDRDQIELKEESIASLEICLRVAHNQVPETDVSLTDVWYVLAMFDKYGASLDSLNYWFAQWFDRQSITDWLLNFIEKPVRGQVIDMNRNPRALLYPTWRFGHVKGFKRVTCFLAYNISAHITEQSPIKRDDPASQQVSFLEHHLSGRIIRELTAEISSSGLVFH